MTNDHKLYEDIKNAITPVLEDFLFQLNDADTRSCVKSRMEEVLKTFHDAGRFDRFAVTCDEFNNIPGVVDNNMLVADVDMSNTGLKSHTKIRFSITPSGTDCQEA